MPKYAAETYDATALQKYLHEQGQVHLRVRKYGDSLIVESGRNDDPVKHARFRRVTVNYWTLEMATHTGRWENTGLRGLMDDLQKMLVEDFGWVLTPIE